MKKTILLSAVLAAGAVFATEVTSGNAVGALDVNLASQKSTLIAVPFVGYGTDGAVAVQDMVKTSELAEGSKLYVPNGTTGNYDTWKLDEDGKWVADKKVTISATQTEEGESLGQETATVNRGDSFWLEPIFKDEGSSGTIFLLGQGADDKGSSAAAAEVWNLVGNASVDSCYLDQLEGDKDDQIIVQVNGALRTYSYKSGKGWRYVKEDLSWSNPNEVAADRLVIAPGQGFWYRPLQARTIDWGTGKVKVAAD